MSEEKIKTEKPKHKICSECGERVKAQGYGGHLFLKHNIKIGMASKFNELQSRLDKLENKKGHPNPGTTEKLTDGISITEDGNVENIPNDLFEEFKIELEKEGRSVKKTIISLLNAYLSEEDEDDDEDKDDNEEDQDDDEKNPGNPSDKDDEDEDQDDDEKNPDDDDEDEDQDDDEKNPDDEDQDDEKNPDNPGNPGEKNNPGEKKGIMERLDDFLSAVLPPWW